MINLETYSFRSEDVPKPFDQSLQQAILTEKTVESSEDPISNQLLNQQSCNNSVRMLSFLRNVGKLKNLKRTGWVKKGVDLPESVSDHMYRMALCCFLITDVSVDKGRCMKMALVHDLAEAIAGDITPHCGVSVEEKRVLEESALNQIVEVLADQTADEIRQLWLEYEEGTTPEALMVKDFDKFEMILQADEYERAQGLDLDDFFQSTEGKFQTPQMTTKLISPAEDYKSKGFRKRVKSVMLGYVLSILASKNRFKNGTKNFEVKEKKINRSHVIFKHD